MFWHLHGVAGPSGEEVPAVWVDRTGVKVGVTEQYSRNSKGSLALVAQVRAGLLPTALACKQSIRLGSSTHAAPAPGWMQKSGSEHVLERMERFSSPPESRRGKLLLSHIAALLPFVTPSHTAGDHDSRRDWRALRTRHAHHALWPVRGRWPPYLPVW